MTEPSPTEVRMVVLVGHPKPRSRTHAAAARAGELLRRELVDRGLPASTPALVDLAELAPHLLDRGRNATAGAALQVVGQAGLLVVASPTFRTAYTGLLKHFLDLLPREALRTTIAVAVTTAGLPTHRRAADLALRPVLLALQAQVPVAGLCLLEDELGRVDEAFATWWDGLGRPLGQVLAEQLREVGDNPKHTEPARAVAGCPRLASTRDSETTARRQ